MIIDTKNKVFDTAQGAIGRMSELQNVIEYSEDLFAFNADGNRAVCILDDNGRGNVGYKFVVIGAVRITDCCWMATYFNDEFEDAIDAMNNANEFLSRTEQEHSIG
jgi:hypothetical protein